MMWVLLGISITTSFFDSLNPSAIAQQMLLQTMVKNKRHIWFFILGIGMANFVLGLAIYYGIAAWVSELLTKVIETHQWQASGVALSAGVLCLLLGGRLIARTKRSAKRGLEETAKRKNPSQLCPLSLFFLGTAFCAVELTSAFPYFGFLAILTSYHLTVPSVLLFVMIYNLIYVLPLILLSAAYNQLQDTALIKRIESALGNVAAYVVPMAITLAGALLVYCGVRLLT